MKGRATGIDRLLRVERPTSYWSFWWTLVRLAPIAVALFAVVTVATGAEIRVETFAPLPFVFVAASFGYAVRDLDTASGLVSLMIAGVYGFLLWLSGTGIVLLRRPTSTLSAVAVLAFVAMIVGFASPWLHGRRQDREFAEAYHEHRMDDDE